MRCVLRTRSARAAAAVPVLLLALSGCSGDSSEPVAAEGQESGAAATSPEPSGTATATPTPEEPAADEPAEATAGEGTWNAKTLLPAMLTAVEREKTSRFRMTMAAGGPSMEAEGALAYRGTGSDLAMTMGRPDGDGLVEMRVVDQVVDMSMPPLTPAGKFIELPADSMPGGFAGFLENADPRRSLEMFESALRGVRFLGAEEVAGETLERYALTLDFAAASEARGLPASGDMPKTIEYDVWVDEQALVRRMVLDLDEGSVDMEMSEWGEPVSIKAPAAADLVEAPGR
jgi:hypothetical protein